MSRSRLSHEDAMTLWRARDVYRVQSVLLGLVLLVFVVEFVGYCLLGYWYLALPLIAFQVGVLWCLRWGLRWLGRRAHQALWWRIDALRDAGQRPHQRERR
jgi:hypothetical protein